MVNSIYIDTSVFGGYYDEIFEDATIRFFDEVVRRSNTLVVSNITEFELRRAPQEVRRLLLQFDDNIKKVESTIETDKLAQEYIDEKVVGKTSFLDCQHIAIATVNKIDILASWNFKHIVNIERIRGYNSVNLRSGYHILEIRNPNEIFSYER